jgi:tetratricopeptide (TPR) repeat protein
LDEAAAFYNAALALDPLGAISQAGLGTISYRMGRLPEAEARLRAAIEVSPTFLWAHWTLGAVLLAAGKLDAALEQMLKATSDGGADAGIALVYHSMKRNAESDAALARATNAFAADRAYVLAQVHAYRGESEQALAWLDRAYRQKDVALYRVKGDPLLKNLEPDPGYSAFLRKMNLLQ